jgi:hypothetical protein
MFRGMGITHIIAGLILGAAVSMGINTGAGNPQAIILSQLIGGALMAAIGFKFKV